MSVAVELTDRAWRLRSRVLQGKIDEKDRSNAANRCLALLESAVEEANKHGDQFGLSYSLSKLAHVRGDLEGRESAIRLYREAAEAGDRAGSGLLRGEALRHWADHLRHMKRFDEALPLYEEALALLESDASTTHNSLGNLYRPLAILYEETGESSLAIRNWRQARHRYQQAGIDSGVAECDDHLRLLGIDV